MEREDELHATLASIHNLLSELNPGDYSRELGSIDARLEKTNDLLEKILRVLKNPPRR